mmetsp:Transcript_2005/g.4261  ORF Transcript_2005/g.4261 Transcript_2005/m.4261 type:complete len:365 (-) Transcript_2005:708-1802(-)
MDDPSAVGRAEAAAVADQVERLAASALSSSSIAEVCATLPVLLWSQSLYRALELGLRKSTRPSPRPTLSTVSSSLSRPPLIDWTVWCRFRFSLLIAFTLSAISIREKPDPLSHSSRTERGTTISYLARGGGLDDSYSSTAITVRVAELYSHSMVTGGPEVTAGLSPSVREYSLTSMVEKPTWFLLVGLLLLSMPLFPGACAHEDSSDDKELIFLNLVDDSTVDIDVVSDLVDSVIVSPSSPGCSGCLLVIPPSTLIFDGLSSDACRVRTAIQERKEEAGALGGAVGGCGIGVDGDTGSLSVSFRPAGTSCCADTTNVTPPDTSSSSSSSSEFPSSGAEAESLPPSSSSSLSRSSGEEPKRRNAF